MFAKLLALLLQTKAAVLTGVFVIGTTGALVSATTQNGITTITITPDNKVELTETSPASSALLNPLSSPETLTPSASPSVCAEQAHARADLVRIVNIEFKTAHNGLEQLAHVNKTAKDLETLRNADQVIKGIRQAAVKLIHATNKCVDDKDENDTDEDAADTAQAMHDDEDKDEDKGDVHAAKTDEHHTTSPITFSDTDPKTIADEAVAAMKLAFETAKNSVTNQVTTPTSPRTPEPKKHDGDAKGNDSRRGDHR